MRKLAAVLTVIPFVALGAQPGSTEDQKTRTDDFSRRIRLVRLLGLAESLDLSEPQVVQLRECLAKYDLQRESLLQRERDVLQVLRRAARGDLDARRQVDQATGRLFEARSGLLQVHQEMFREVSKDLPPAKRARAMLFLAQFRERFGAGSAARRDSREDFRSWVKP